MAEYIEREAVLEFQDKIEPELFCVNLNGERVQSGSETFSASNLIRFICSIPSADVQPVRHGRLLNPNPYGECSLCGQLIDIRDSHNYCPNCGARMDGGETA